MANNRLHPVHLNSVTPGALLLPSGRAPSSLAGRDRVFCAVEVIDCRAAPEQFRQRTQLDAAARLRQTSSSINCASPRGSHPDHLQSSSATAPSTSSNVQPQPVSFNRRDLRPHRRSSATTNSNRSQQYPGLCRMSQGPQRAPHLCQRRNTPTVIISVASLRSR